MFNRKFEECDNNLAQLIIRKSYSVAQKKTLHKVVKEYFFGGMFISKPNFVYLSVALFACGMVMELSMSQTVNVFDFMDTVYIGI